MKKKGRTSISRLVAREYPECCICRLPLKSNKKKFKCRIHYAHSFCVDQYYHSRQNANFKCPM